MASSAATRECWRKLGRALGTDDLNCLAFTDPPGKRALGLKPLGSQQVESAHKFAQSVVTPRTPSDASGEDVIVAIGREFI